MSADVPSTQREFSELVSVYLPVGLTVLVLVTLALLLPLVLFRRGRRAEPSRRSSNTRLEVGYAVVLTVIAAGLAWRSLDAIADLQTVPRHPAVTIRAVAAKWNWRFEYPGGVVAQGSESDPPVMVVPEDRPVRVEITSIDVVHAFWVPEIRAKYDALPGYTNVLNTVFPDAGRLDLARCSEFCGERHAQMRFAVDVRPPAAFAAWLTRRQAEVTGR